MRRKSIFPVLAAFGLPLDLARPERGTRCDACASLSAATKGRITVCTFHKRGVRKEKADG